jgi:hypothetical protein
MSNAYLGARADSSGTAMVVNGLDLNYLGVSNVWTNDIGSFTKLFVDSSLQLTGNRSRLGETLHQH